MLTIAVMNAKGGCGKTTIATHLAALFALQGRTVALADLDRQRSSRMWLERRPANAPPIERARFRKGEIVTSGRATRLVVDGAAAMERAESKWVIARAGIILIPVLPSAYDQEAATRMLKAIGSIKRVRKRKRSILFVANRHRARTRAATELDEHLAAQDWPVIARLRDSQLYARAADTGLSLFELRERRAREYAADWQELADFLESRADD